MPKKIYQLENKISSAIMNGVKLSQLYSQVDKLASLRAEATKLQLDCVYETNKILTEKQIDYLLHK